jgi:hypothetical protein
MSEHRGHLLPDTEDIFLPRGAATVGLHTGRRQRIYRSPRSSRAPRYVRLPPGELAAQRAASARTPQPGSPPWPDSRALAKPGLPRTL